MMMCIKKNNKKGSRAKKMKGIPGFLVGNESFVHWVCIPFVAWMCSQKHAASGALGAQQMEAQDHTYTSSAHAPHGTKWDTSD